jgi:hypothetical protein
MSTRRVSRPLSPAAVQAANEAIWDAHSKLKGRALTMEPGDYAFRKEWIDAYVAAGGKMKGADSAKALGSPVQACQSSPMTESEAAEWMKDFKDKRTDIPFDWPRDCCYTRAREMANELKSQGCTVGKVWNYAPPGGELRAQTRNVMEGYVLWGYHVAPTVPIQRKDGSITDMVLDPSLSDQPLTPVEWKGLQGNPKSILVPSDASPYYRSPSGSVMQDPGDAEVKRTLAEHRANRAMEPQ